MVFRTLTDPNVWVLLIVACSVWPRWSIGSSGVTAGDWTKRTIDD